MEIEAVLLAMTFCTPEEVTKTEPTRILLTNRSNSMDLRIINREGNEVSVLKLYSNVLIISYSFGI